MKKNITQPLLEIIDEVFEFSKDCKLDPSIFKKKDKQLSTLAAYFGVTNTQAFFAAMVFSMHFKDSKADLSGLAEQRGRGRTDAPAGKHAG